MGAYTDLRLTWRGCGAAFVFAAEEQRSYASRGPMDRPGRCPACRGARSAGGPGPSARLDAPAGGDKDAGPPSRRMHPATCARCGRRIAVSFPPRGPVYCRGCYPQLGRSG
jgi:CxxC-x17-CxxC domain-containing protein